MPYGVSEWNGDFLGSLFMLTREVMQTQLCSKPPRANGFQVHCFMPTKNKEIWTQKNKKNTDSLWKIENEFTRLGQAPKEKPPCAALIVCVALSFMERIQWSLSRLTRDLVFSVHIMGTVNEKSICPVLVVLALPKNFLSSQGRGHMTSW